MHFLPLPRERGPNLPLPREGPPTFAHDAIKLSTRSRALVNCHSAAVSCPGLAHDTGGRQCAHTQGTRGDLASPASSCGQERGRALGHGLAHRRRQAILSRLEVHIVGPTISSVHWLNRFGDGASVFYKCHPCFWLAGLAHWSSSPHPQAQVIVLRAEESARLQTWVMSWQHAPTVPPASGPTGLPTSHPRPSSSWKRT